jgi:glycosyltransferase involved in cell wall biosynthesis
MADVVSEGLRLAIIAYSEKSNWPSCRTICANLTKAYKKAFTAKAKFFSIGRQSTPGELKRMAQRIYRARPDRLVFIDDHFPHPGQMILALHEIFAAQLPPIYVHVYGDFCMGSSQWLALNKILLKTKIRFVAASRRHQDFVAAQIRGGENSTAQCPFPVETANYFLDRNLRAVERKRLGLQRDDLLVIYTGRLTYQKNVLRTISEVSRQIGAQPRRIFLYLAGHFDDHAGPLDLKPVTGLFYQQYLSCLAKVPPKDRDRIQFLGSLGGERLHALYNAADLYMSLSTFHDEDFGMSPAEALVSGCPALLTDWGGYSSFNLDSRVNYVPVHIDKKGVYLNSAEIQDSLQRSLFQGGDERERRSRVFQDFLSIDSVARQLNLLHRQPHHGFRGFSPEMRLLARRAADPSGFFPEGMGRHSPYYRIYRSYMERPIGQKGPHSPAISN